MWRSSIRVFADDTMFFCKSDPLNCATLKEILGLPELFGRKKKDLFTSIVDRIRQKACSWSSKFLSSAGKMVMLKSVLAAMPSYSMSCFKLPNSLYKRIQSTLTRFWWSQSFNDALLAKISWRILSKPNCLLAKILLGKYCHKTPFLESSPPSSSSHGWRGILIGKDLLKSKLGRVIGNGSNTSLWNDPWISLDAPQTPMGPATENNQHATVDSLFHPGTYEWNKQQVQKTFPDLSEKILEIKPSKLGAADAYAWLPTKSGIYSVGENLRSRQILTDATCPFCGDRESSLHLFFHCRYASQIWNAAPLKTSLDLTQITSMRTGIEASKLLTCLPPSGIGNGPVMPWILWRIWLARNQLIFSQRHESPQETLSQALSLAREWQLAQVSEPKETRSHSACALIRPIPDPEMITCHTDAAWDESTKAGGAGWIFANHRTDLRREGHAMLNHVRSPLQAEALALHLALLAASENHFTKLSIASDSKQLIEAINSESPSKELHGILHDILSISSSFHTIVFRFVPRENNKEADAIAKLALRSSVNVCSPPRVGSVSS